MEAIASQAVLLFMVTLWQGAVGSPQEAPWILLSMAEADLPGTGFAICGRSRDAVLRLNTAGLFFQNCAR